MQCRDKRDQDVRDDAHARHPGRWAAQHHPRPRCDGTKKDHAEATAFAQRWADDWNRKDLEALLSHFTDDVIFTSPIAARAIPESGGVLHGKEAVRRYWAEGLRRIPDLHFEVEAVYAGVSAIVVNYRNHTGALVCEVLRFDGPLIAEGHGTYLTDDAAGASGVLSGRAEE